MQVSETPANFPYIKPFEMLSKGKKPSKATQTELIEIPSKYPEVLKKQIATQDLHHLPLATLVSNIGLFLIIFLPQFIPNFYLGAFTFKIEYFITLIALYFTIRTLQNSWYSNQDVQLIGGQSNLLIKRSNRVFGESIDYFANIDKVEREYKPRTPNFFEYLILFLPIMQIVWLCLNYVTYAEYFFTQNLYTILYITVIVGIFFLLATEYIFPKPNLSITPQAQNPQLKTLEKYSIYFPVEKILKKLPLLETIKRKTFLHTSYKGILLILIPVLFALTWIILSSLGVMPHISETIF